MNGNLRVKHRVKYYYHIIFADAKNSASAPFQQIAAQGNDTDRAPGPHIDAIAGALRIWGHQNIFCGIP